MNVQAEGLDIVLADLVFGRFRIAHEAPPWSLQVFANKANRGPWLFPDIARPGLMKGWKIRLACGLKGSALRASA
jgi:hypothetical protein